MIKGKGVRKKIYLARAAAEKIKNEKLSEFRFGNLGSEEMYNSF